MKHARHAVDPDPDFSNLPRTARRHGIVVLQAWRLDELRRLKESNPGVKVLVYKNLSFAVRQPGPRGLSSSGVSYRDADVNHPDWFLENTRGERFPSNAYDFLWAMDVGNVAYQDAWASNVIAELVRNGWDGVFIDDANPTLEHHYPPWEVAKYPTDRSYSAATRSALARIGPRVRATGKLAIANNSQWVDHFDVGVDWLQFLDGMMDEMFVKWEPKSASRGYRPERQWVTQLKEIKAAEDSGRIFVGVTRAPNSDARAARYGYATTLLAGRGRTHFAHHGDYTHEPWFPEYDLDLGVPVAEEARGPEGVHRRPFTNGLVLVNPTSETRRVSLGGGGTYSGSGLSRAREVDMEPQSGLVLVRDP